MWNYLWIGILKTISIGILDLLEFKFFNPLVFYQHNFPDIVPDLEPGIYAAFISGVKCSWFLFLPLSVIYYFLNVNIVAAILVTMLEFLIGLAIMIMNKDDKDIFLNHKMFYLYYPITGIITCFL